MENIKLLILILIGTIQMNGFAQDWEPISESEKFPELDFDEAIRNRHPSWMPYEKRSDIRHEKAMKKFGFKEYYFDAELGDHKKEFSEIIDSVISLLPPEIKIDSISRYLNSKNGKWTVDVKVKGKIYSFSTYPADGDFMELVSFWESFTAILQDHSPEYKMTSIDGGQAMSVIIQKEEDLILASKEGFQYSTITSAWKIYRRDLNHLYIPSFSKINEEKLSKSYVEEFNRISKKILSKKRILIENFWICDIENGGLLYIFDNNKDVGTPKKVKGKMRCSPSLSEYLFAYCLVKENDSKVYFEDIHNKKRKETCLEEIEEIILNNLQSK